MPGDGSSCSWLPVLSWKGGVDCVGDLVGEVVVSEGGCKAEGGVRVAQSQLEKVWVRAVSGAGVDTACDAFQVALGGQRREIAVGDPEVAGLGVRERDRSRCRRHVWNHSQKVGSWLGIHTQKVGIWPGIHTLCRSPVASAIGRRGSFDVLRLIATARLLGASTLIGRRPIVDPQAWSVQHQLDREWAHGD